MWNCHQVNATRPNWWSVNIGSDNGLMPSGTKPLSEPMLTQVYEAKWCHKDTMTKQNTWTLIILVFAVLLFFRTEELIVHLLVCESIYLWQVLPNYITNIMLYIFMHYHKDIDSLAPGGFDCGLKIVNFKLIPTINILSIFCKIAIRWMPLHLTDH